MSYTPTNWQTGDTITAEKLNNMESGIENANNPFVVTLTPTEQDFSGVMDKTVAEINSAFEAGKRVFFSVDLGDNSSYSVECTAVYSTENDDYPSFEGWLLMYAMNMLAYIYTGATNTGTENTYATHLFMLTPYSS